MVSLSTVNTGDLIVSSHINQFTEALNGQASVPISISGVNDAANYGLTVRNADATNARTFRAQDSSATTRFDVAGTSTSYVRADPDGSGLSVIATLGHPQTISSKTFTNSSFSLMSASSNAVQVPQARVTHNATQTITNATITALTFNTERWDNDNLHSTTTNATRLTPSRAGLWDIGGNVEFEVNSSGTRDAAIRLNGAANYVAYLRVAAAAAQTTILNVSGAWQLSTTDYLELVVQQNSGANLGTSTASGVSPEFWMTYRGAT